MNNTEVMIAQIPTQLSETGEKFCGDLVSNTKNMAMLMVIGRVGFKQIIQ